MSINPASAPGSLHVPDKPDSATDIGAADIGAARLVVWTILFQIAWNITKLPGIMLQGIMPDPDDFLRLHQIRNWMDGQGWFDVSVPRMDPAFGGDMHWSRLVDMPIAALINVISFFTSQTMAERLTAIIWPTLLLVCLVLVMTAICRKVVPQGNKLVTLLFIVMCLPAMVEFAPGRIDHHNVQILLFSLALLGLVNRDTGWGHYLIGATIAGSIAVGIDTFLLLIVLLGFVALDWALGRDQRADGLFKTGIALVSTVLLLFVLSVPPQNWLAVRPDSISIFYVTLLVLIGGGFALLYLANPLLPRSSAGTDVVLRLGAGLAVASIIVTVMFSNFPDIFGGGLVGLSQDLQERWLSNIIEAKSLAATLAIMPGHWISTVAYCLVLAGAGAYVLRTTSQGKSHLITIYAMMMLSIAATLFQFRLMRTGIIASIPVCVAFFYVCQQRLLDGHQRSQGKSKSLRIAIFVGLTTLLLAPFWLALSLAIPDPRNSSLAQAQIAATAGKPTPRVESASPSAAGWRKQSIYPVCNKASQYKTLANLPAGLVMADLDSGPQVLVFTGHSIHAGNYHRNGRAILQVMDFFQTNLANAKRQARGLRVDYVAFCDPGTPVPQGKGHDGKLGAHILKNTPPRWLKRISPLEERMIVLKVIK